ncbi:hypothetical protein [Porticoccus sp.]
MIEKLSSGISSSDLTWAHNDWGVNQQEKGLLQHLLVIHMTFLALLGKPG